MPHDLQYLPSYKNIGKLLENIYTAKAPEAFTHNFLTSTLGLKSTADRALIPLLKTLGFLDPAGKPTQSYMMLKNKTTAPAAIAAGIRKAYEPLFTANENAHELQLDALKGLIAQVAGTDESMTNKIAYTFNSLVKYGDFKTLGQEDEKETEDEGAEDEEVTKSKDKGRDERRPKPEFHYNIQIHLPSNATEETYLNIFNALRKTLA
jgi:hypothetical protein